MIDDLKLIKKHYGEKMMHLCRELFPTILENEGALFELMSKTFDYNKELYDDIVNVDKIEEFKSFIYEKYNDIRKEKKSTEKTASELLSEAGYDLHECKTEEDIQKFKKYYAKGEELCTFRGHRLDSCLVFFAVKKNANDIKRKDYKDPKREDEYGTSVISIQFSKSNNYVSIKNRYNHSVSNPDATYSNNLDNIIPGLTYAFERDYNLKVANSNRNKLELYNYIYASDKKFYKLNFEAWGISFCKNNIIIQNFEVNKSYIQPERYIFADNYIIDLKEKRIFDYAEEDEDGFIKSFGKINKIKVIKEKTDEIKTIYFYNDKEEEVVLKINKNNNIISYRNNYITNIEDGFLSHNEELYDISLPNAITIGLNFLENNIKLDRLSLPKVTEVDDYFLTNNYDLIYLDMQNLVKVNDCFLTRNQKLCEFNFPNLKYVGDNFICNHSLSAYMNFDSLVSVGDFFLCDQSVKSICFPNLDSCGHYFLSSNYVINDIRLPKIRIIGNSFLSSAKNIKLISLPNVHTIGNCFLNYNVELKNVYLPNVVRVGSHFLQYNESLEEIKFDKLEIIGDEFLTSNINLNSVSLPNVSLIGRGFLELNNKISSIFLPNLCTVNDRFLAHNTKIKYLYLPKLREIYGVFMTDNMLEKIDFPLLRYSGRYFLFKNTTLKEANLPSLEIVDINFLEANEVLEKINIDSLPSELKSRIINSYIRNIINDNTMRLRRK